MSSYQYVYHMDNLAKTYPGGKQVFSGISLHFLPDAKIGVVGVNGAGKSSLLRIMAGQDQDFTGEAWAEKGVRVGYLPQEPQLDPEKRSAACFCPSRTSCCSMNRPTTSMRNQSPGYSITWKTMTAPC